MRPCIHGQSFILQRPSRADVKDASHSARDSCKTAPAHHQRRAEQNRRALPFPHPGIVQCPKAALSCYIVAVGGGSCARSLHPLFGEDSVTLDDSSS
eukprot:6489546-Amphidinium_carterae.1